MALNCKPGDLAMVVRAVTSDPCDRALIGRTIIRVTKIRSDVFSDFWEFEGPPRPCPLGGKCKFTMFDDATLMPLNAPGFRVEDETPTQIIESLTAR